MRSRRRGSIPISRESFTRRAFASVSEKVVRRTRASGWTRARWAARWSATTVFPVPAEPATRAGPAEVPLDQLPLRGVEEHRPALPRVLQGAGQLLHTGHDAEAAPRIGVVEGVGGSDRRGRLGNLDRHLGNGVRDRGGLQRSASTGRRARGTLPVARSSTASAASAGKWSASASSASSLVACRTSASHSTGTPWLSSSSSETCASRGGAIAAGRAGAATGSWDDDLVNPLPDLDQLGRACLRVRLELPALRPGVRLVVVVHVAEQQAVSASGAR